MLLYIIYQALKRCGSIPVPRITTYYRKQGLLVIHLGTEMLAQQYLYNNNMLSVIKLNVVHSDDAITYYYY